MKPVPECWPDVRIGGKSASSKYFSIILRNYFRVSRGSILGKFETYAKKCLINLLSTVVPTKSDSDVIVCLQLLSKI